MIVLQSSKVGGMEYWSTQKSPATSAGGVLEYSKMPAEVGGWSTGVLKKAQRLRRAEYWSTQKCPPKSAGGVLEY